MDYFTKSKNPYWERDVYLKIIEKSLIPEAMCSSNYCRLILIINGNTNLIYNGIPYEIEAPHLLFLSEADSILTQSDNNLECYTLFFQPIALNDLLSSDILLNREHFNKMSPTVYQDAILLDSFYGISREKTWKIPLLPGSKQVVLQLFSKINRELEEQDSDYWPCRSRSYFIELLFFLTSIDLLELHSNKSKSNEIHSEDLIFNEFKTKVLHSDQLHNKGFQTYELHRKNKDIYYEVENIIRYLKEHIAEKILLEHLCKKFARNRNQINQIFTSVTGLTAISYLGKLRIEFSEYLLKNTELPINEIAIRSGYTDFGYFCRLFKSLHHMTPIQYRKHNALYVASFNEQ